MRSNIYIIFLTVLILYCCYTVAIVTLFQGSVLYRVFLGLFTFISFLFLYRKRKHISSLGIITYMVIAGGSLFSSKGYLPDVIVIYTAMSPILTFFMLREKDLKSVLLGVNKILCILVFISLFIFLLITICGPFSSSRLQNFEQYYYYNFFYILIDAQSSKGRFSGFTLEPGYISVLLVSLLLINKYDFKRKSTCIYFTSLLCTVSLGGYLLGLIGYVLQKITEKNNVKNILFFLCTFSFFLFLIICIIFAYNNGNNILMEKIIERLVFDEDLGVVGNNRENDIAKDIIDTYFYSDNVWFGIGSRNLSQALNMPDVDTCSWRLFVLANGAVYTLFFFVLSFLFLLKTKIRVVLPFFVVYWLDFYQHGTLYSETLYLLLLYMITNLKNKTITMCIDN